MRNIKLFVLLVLVSPGASFGQLSIGNRFSGRDFNHVINLSANHIDISSLKNKLIILDFWGTGCTECVEAFPHLDSVQKIYGDKIQIVLVNQSTEDSTRNFFARHRRIKIPYGIPLITQDSILSKDMFPHVRVPIHVWLDSNKTIIHITEGYNLTEQHINDYLSGKSFRIKERYYEPTEQNKPLITFDNGKYLDKVDYYSYLMHFPGNSVTGEWGTFPDENGIINHIAFNGSPVLSLLIGAYEEGHKYNFHSKRLVELNVADKSSLTEPTDKNLYDSWASANLYDYDLLIPKSMADKLYLFMQQDMERYFHFHGLVIKKVVSCLVLRRMSVKDLLHTKGGKPGTNFFRLTTDTTLYLKNMSFQSLVGKLYQLNDNLGTLPFIDETGYRGNIDFEINTDNLLDFRIDKINATLNIYGLELVEEERQKDVLQISDVK